MRDIKDRTPNQSTIDVLKRLLDQAESGELRSLYYVLSFDDQSVDHGWSLDHRCKPRMILAEMVMTQHDHIVNIEMMEKDSVLATALNV